MRCVDYRWLLREHSQASIEFVYSHCREEKNYMRPIYALLLGFPFSVKLSNLKHRLLDALFKIKRQSEVAKKKFFAGDCRENRLKVFNSLRRSCEDVTRYMIQTTKL